MVGQVVGSHPVQVAAGLGPPGSLGGPVAAAGGQVETSWEDEQAAEPAKA